MIIEFTDPGIEWTPLWWSLGILAVGIVMFFIGFALMETYGGDGWPVPGGVLTLMGACLAIAALISQPLSYTRYTVPDATVTALEQAGYESVTLTGDLFIANDNGEFFSGVLVDLQPESGYAYQVLELTDTTN